jgi:tetratricopeptide (TPR) repeat protein
MAALADNPSTPAAQPKRRWRLWLSILGGLVLLAAVGFGGWRTYLRVREDSIVQKARNFYEKKDYSQALIAAQWALRVSPTSVEPNRIMADLADVASSSQAVFWWRTVAQLAPGVPEYHFKWAEAGLRGGNLPMAQQALTGLPEAARTTAAFHEVAARVAQATGRPAEAVTHFTEAVRLEPGNENYRFGLATARLEAGDRAARDEARAAIEKFRTVPQYRQRAHRVLIQDHFRRSEWKEGFLLAADLQAIPDAAFEDRMLLLDLLRKFQRPELHTYLMDVQTVAARTPEHTATLLTWLNQNTMALIAADWSKTLPEDIRTQYPVPAAIAEAYTNLRDWKRLKPMVAGGNWGHSDFMRLAVHARVLREEDEVLASRAKWTEAIKATGQRPEALEQLARFASGMKWDAEATDLLWQVARSKDNPQWAIAALREQYAGQGNTRGMLNVATRRLEIDPANLAAKNDVAALSLLLNSNLERAIALAREARRRDPENPIIATTYGFAEHLAGNTEEALKIYRGLPAELLQSPAVAAYYGVLLAYGGSPDEAVKSLDLAEAGKLLAEERELVVKTRAMLKDRASERSVPGR